MGKKSKTGHQRKDKFYHLAKETGYRSRAAFKLIQLNRKFEFLQKSRVLIDLCAAPGGWMQVAKQNMPVSSVVVGVDMYPFRPLPGCITLIEDITTDECRIAIQKELKTWKADVVLHDGAPNVGKNWLHDAYTQSCLTLSALKMATTFLREGGWFVTKIFRSKDYNSLLWVFKQLFKKVHATKPQASRNESAEIFVICHYYLAPKKVDPKFLNPDYVFKEIEAAPEVSLRLGKEKKAKVEGYPDDTTILHTKLNASTFMQCENPAISLQNAYEIVFDDDEILNNPATTEEIKKCCEDIKVLGRKELRALVAWWKVFQKKKPSPENDNNTSTETNEIAEGDDDKLSEEEKELDEINKQVQELEDEERRALKRKRKKVNKEKEKIAKQINLNMKHADDAGPIEEADHELFQLSQISTKAILKKVVNQRPNIVLDPNEGSKTVKFPKKIKYDPEKTYLDSSGNYYRTGESEEENDDEDETDSERESLGLSDDDDDEQQDYEIKNKRNSSKKKTVRFADTVVDNEPTIEPHPLLTDLDYREPKDKRLSKAELWFDKDVFKDIEKEEDEDYELDKMTSIIKNLGGKIIEKADGTEDATNLETRYNKQHSDDDHQDDDDDSSSDENDEDADNKNSDKKTSNQPESKVAKTNGVLGVVNEPINEWDIDGENVTTMGKKRKKKERKTLDSVGLALGSMIVDSKKVKRDIIDAAWNRYAFNDENLPDWFVQDEQKHMTKEAPVPKDLVDEYEKRKEEINVRPIKKVAEAKARKKKRAARHLEKAKKKLEGVMENPDATDNEKARQIRKIYRKIKEPKPEVKYIVAKKHTAAKRMRRPRGLKGPYKVVDPRMKKDLKAKINKMTKNKSKTAAKKIKKTFKPNRRK